METLTAGRSYRARPLLLAIAWLLTVVALLGMRHAVAAGAANNPFPAFPQRVALLGPVPASFALAVTQPGPVVVDVQVAGAPVLVTLRGVDTPPIQQMGSGHVTLSHVVTAADVQRSALWSVSVAISPNVPPLPVPQANGTISVQQPPADLNIALAHARNLAARPPLRAADSAAPARLANEMHSRQAKLDQDAAHRRAAQQAANQPLLNQLMAKRAGAVQTRAVAPEAPAAAANAGDGVGTRAVGPDKSQAVLKSSGALPPTAGRQMTLPVTAPSQSAPPPPPPAPVITALYQAPNVPLTQARPLDQVVIVGSNFGNSPAALVFKLGPGTSANEVIAVEGGLTTWTDSMIVATVPDASHLLPYQAGVWVSMGSVSSNTATFTFVPAAEVRHINWTGDMSLAKGATIDGHQIQHLNTSFGKLSGATGNDIFFVSTNLQNGWTVQSIVPETAGTGNPFGSGVYVQDSHIQSNPASLFFNLRWWYNTFADSQYDYTVWITGPRGVSDGVTGQ